MSNAAQLVDVVNACRRIANFDPLVNAIPYATFLGMKCVVDDKGDIGFVLPARAENIGNPTLPALHGGAIAGFMEHSALIYLLATMGTPRMPKTVDLSIDYLRAGHYRDAYASCTVTRQGRRVANVMITCWQDNRDEPIAQARAHFLLAETEVAGAAGLADEGSGVRRA